MLNDGAGMGFCKDGLYKEGFRARRVLVQAGQLHGWAFAKTACAKKAWAKLAGSRSFSAKKGCCTDGLLQRRPVLRKLGQNWQVQEALVQRKVAAKRVAAWMDFGNGDSCCKECVMYGVLKQNSRGKDS